MNPKRKRLRGCSLRVTNMIHNAERARASPTGLYISPAEKTNIRYNKTIRITKVNRDLIRKRWKDGPVEVTGHLPFDERVDNMIKRFDEKGE